MPGLGRLASKDERDQAFPIRALLPARASTRRWRNWWTHGWRGDQDDTPHCVGFAWTHWLHAGPTTQPGSPVLDPHMLYRAAQQLDEWPGEAYEGTSVRGGAKALVQHGYVGEYRWAFTIDDVVQAVLELGPVVVGTDWFESMFYPNKAGEVRVQGGPVGGHAYLLYGVNRNTKRFHALNSWGPSWGKNGTFSISIDDMGTLLDRDGEACLAVEHRQP